MKYYDPEEGNLVLLIVMYTGSNRLVPVFEFVIVEKYNNFLFSNKGIELFDLPH